MSNKIYTIEEIKAILEKLLENTPVCKVILFGSYAKKIANQESDLDFIIDTNGTLMGFDFFALIDEIGKKFKKNIDAFEKIEIIENSKIDNEIKQTGVVVYER